MVTVSAMATTLFLGGWYAPWPLSLWEGANQGWWPLLWWLVKVQIFIFGFIWLRGTLPRMRYDQFMKFGWKVLIPVSIAWIMIVSVARVLRNEVSVTTTEILIGGAILIVLLLIGSWLVQSRQDRRDRAEEEAEAIALATPFDPMAGGFPVPPMPGQEFTFTSRRAMAQGTTIVQEPATVASDESTDGTEEDHHA
jgi:NADH-quinone oxidoreductase subunit H